MITELLADIRQKLTHQRADIDDIAKKTGVSRRTLYYVIEGKSLTVGTIDKLSKYFERTVSQPTSRIPRIAGRRAQGRVTPGNRSASTNGASGK